MEPQYGNQQLPPPPGNVYSGPPPATDKWWQEPWVGIVCTFICCWPLGLYLVWTSPKNSDSTKKLVTAIWAVLYIVGGIGYAIAVAASNS